MMELTPVAQWLNEFFGAFDHAILSFYHMLAEKADWFFGPLVTFLGVIGDNGILYLTVAILLCLFKKTRWIGVSVGFAVGLGALMTNFILKDLIARPRPFFGEYAEWWRFVKAPLEDEFSFPSGHVTAAMSAATALSISLFKKWKWMIAPATFYVILMGFSRNYLMVHYPSDILGAILVGAIAATGAVLLSLGLRRLLERYRSFGLFRFGLEFDVIDLFKRGKKEPKDSAKK